MHSIPVRILLVDDDISQHSQFVRLINELVPNQHQLHWCSNFSDAPSSLQTGAYDVIFLDASKDHLMSRRLLSATLSHGCTAPIVMLCDPERPELKAKVLAAGAMDVLFKGAIDAEVLERVIRYATMHNTQNQRNQGESPPICFDPLTGLPNRQLFMDRLAQAVSRAERDSGSLALFCFDLDGFKKVNESYGHDAGDQLIEMIAERLQGCVNKTDTVARIGGDEFAVIVDAIEHKTDLANIAQALTDVMTRPFSLGGHRVIVSSSLGIAVYPEAGETSDTLLKNADLAKQKAKTMEGCAYRFYNDQINVEAMSQLYREADLRRGLRRHEFELYYQPRIALSTGSIIGMEALIRWRHPVRGLVMPDDFIPLAEETGLISPIGYWVVRQACADIKAMDEMGLQPLDVAVNLSFKQFQDEKFLENTTEIIFSSGIDPKRLEFELTETAIMANAEEAHRCMRSLNRLGPTFSLDDFGTGYSSFAHIQRLPINSLKVDRSFIKNVTENSEDAMIVKAMINLAHSLNMTVVAEGAETAAQMHFLRSNNCDQVQGFYFSPAVIFEDMVQLVMNDERVVVLLG